MDESILTVTGVIATVLSLIFAAGAILNSRARRKNLGETEAEASSAADNMKFKMPPIAAPAGLEQAAPSVANPPRPSVDSASHPPQALFRQVRPRGAVDGDDGTVEDTLYVWE